MAEVQWTPVLWQPDDVITSDKMQQDTNNLEWIRNNTARAKYKYGIAREQGVRIMAGIATVPRTSDSTNTVSVNFGEYFSTGCIPIVTTGIVSPHRRIHVTITGHNQLLPDERGFKIYAQMDNPNTKNKNNVLDSKIYVPWQAMGY